MSALSEFIEGKLRDRYGSGQELQDNITASNGSWYHTGVDEDSSAAYDLASIFGGSAMSNFGDITTGIGVISKDLLKRYGEMSKSLLKPFAEYVGDAGNGQPVVNNAISDWLTSDNQPVSDWLINNGQYLSNTGSEITGRHMKQGKSKDGSWQDKGFLDRLSSLDYWTDPYGIGADAAVMGGSLAGQAPLMALVPGGLVGRVAGGLLGRLGTGALTKAATESGMGKYLAEMATGGVAKQAERVMRGPTVNAMGDWAIRTAPLTALTNAGGIYGDLKEQGYSDDEIAKNMYGMMAEEMPQDFLTGALSGLALSGKLGRVLGGKNASRLRQFGQNFAINAPIEVASEYFDEANQQRLQNKYSNKPYGENILNLLPDEAAAGASAAGPAVIPGLVGGARNVITRGKSFNEAYGEYRKKKALQSMRQQIQNTNEELSEAVDNANADMMNMPTDTPIPQSPAGNGVQPQANNTATGTVENAAAPFMGQRMDNGENGCVEAVTKIGAGINGFLKNELDNGVVGVPKLVEDAEKNGVEVVSFSPDNVAAGDVIVYGDNDHVVMADGNGGYVGNSTSQQKVVQGDDYNAMGDLKPTKIIKTGSGVPSTGGTATSSAGNSGGTYSGDYAIDYAINEAAQKYNVDPALLAAIAKQESGFNQSAQSGSGAVGVMQLMPDTAKGLGVDANDLQGNIEGGAKYIRQMLDMYDGDVEKALAAYNAGAGNLDRVNGDISKLSEETRNYVPAVMANYEGFKGSKNSDNAPQLKLDTSDIFGDMTDDDISDILTDFSIAAMEDEDLTFPGLDNLLERGINKGHISKEETQNILDNGMEQFLSYLNTEINKPDAKLAEALAERAAGHKNKKAMVRIQNAISTGDTPVIKQVANKYRQQLENIRSNIYYAGDNSTPAEIDSKNIQPIKANATTPATPKTEQGKGPEIKQTDINHAQNKELTPQIQQGNNQPNAISPQQVSRVQEQQGAAMADIALQQAFAMGKIAQEKQERIRQAQAIQSVAEANNISLPKAIKPALEAGAVKAIQKAQEVIAPSLDEIKGDVKNENIESTESSKTKTTEGIYSEDKVQHSEPEQIEGPAKVNNPDIELGVHHNTKTHEEQPSAVIHKKLDWKRLKELAKKHNGWYSRYAKKYLFNTTEDRDGFVADVNREFFSKNDNAVDNQQADEAANKAVEQAEQEAKSKNAKDEQTDSDENDYHGFLDDKKPGEIAEIKRVLQAKTDPFGGDNGYVTSKHIMETLARSNAKGEVKNNRYYINGERTKKAAYAYFEYLRKIGYKGNETAGAEQEHISNDNTDNSQPELTEDSAREEIEKTANDFLAGKVQGEEAIAQFEKIRKYFAGNDNPNKSFEMVKLCNNKISMVEEITAPFADEKYQAGNLRFADEYRRYHQLESAPLEELGAQKNRSLPVYSTPHESKHDGNYTDGSYTDKGGSMRGRVKDGIIEVWEKAKDISKKDWSISISIADIDKAVAEGGTNSAYSLKQLAGKLYREEMKKWFENHTADDREYREDNWQRFADDWGTNPATDRAVDSVQNVLNELYKTATGNKVESPWEAHQHKKEEKENGEERTESERLAGGREDVQSSTDKTVEEGGDGASGVSGKVSGHGRRKGENDSDSVGGKDSEESGPDGVPAGTELEETAGKGASKRGSEQSAALTAEKAESTAPGGNWEIKESASGKTSKTQRFKQNIEAIKLLKKLEKENSMPTHEEQAVLAAYNGWGGLKEAFVDGTKENTELKALLTPEEYNAAKATMNDAFYTSPDIVRAIWKGVSRLGFKGGRILDPSMGVGNFFGCMPRGMMAKSDLHGVEIDSLTSRLAKMLYPGAFVDNKGFQDAATPDNFFDLVISNIPFGQKKIDGYQIHNYFFANGIDKVRPGGLMVFITSQGSLIGGKDGNRMRSYLASKADMLGAFKLPTTAFDEAGTSVVTDIVIMRKRNEDNIQSPNAQDFLTVGKREEYNSYYGPAHTAPINEYFKEHPDNIIGKIAVEKNQYGDYAVTVKQKDGSDVAQELERAMQSLPEGEYKARTREKAKSFDTVSASKQAAANDKTRDYEYYMSGSKVVQNQNGQAVEIAGKKKIAVLTSFINLKNDLKALITAQLDPKTTDKKLESLRGILNRDYDEFVSKHGYLNSPAVSGNFIQDPSAGMVMALEKVQTEGAGKKKKIVKAEKNDIFFTRTIKAVEEVNKADNPSDALLFSLANKNGVDLEYMAGLLKSTPEKVAASLKGQIYKNPITGDYETSEEYLSGNVREKLAQAKTEAKKDKAYRENVEALEKVVPEDLVSDEILVNIGSPWVPVSDMQDFVNHLVGRDGQKDRETVKFLQNAGKWEISEYYNSPKYKANGIEFGKLLEDIFNNKSIAIYDKAYDGGKEKAVLNVEKTDAANLVADDIRREFTEWLWSDKEREKRLVRYYNDNFNNSVTREYNGAHLTFPGKNAAITLRPHQKNVVWRMLQRVNTLIAHCVGAGKTFEMQAAGMEMRRLGIAQKPMYCLPNNVVEQFAREFRQLYPNAKLLVLTNDDLPAVPKTTKTVKTEDGRKKKVKNEALDKLPAEEKAKIIEKRAARLRTLARIKTEDWDGIIISHNMFERFPLTPETTAAFIQEQVDTLERTVKEAKGERMSKRSISGMETRIANLKEKLKDILDTDLDDIGIPFEQLGIDQLFVDEADMFKNLYYTTSMDRVSGLAQSNANRSNDMFAKTQWLTRAMGGRGVVFATGTPISNTMAEMYTMLRYLDMQGLKEKKLDMFDNWIRTFAEVGSGMERKPTGDGFRKVNKVKRFINMADLNKMFRKVADVKTQEDLDLDIPKLKNGKPTIVKIKADESLLDYIKNVVPKRVADMKKGFKHEKGEDNMLALTNDLRKMSLNDDKINACADQIAKKYEETTDIKGAQLVFCDMGIPRAEKDNDSKTDSTDLTGGESESENAAAYEKLIRALKDRGIPEKQIAFVQSAKNKTQMDAMFQKVDNGDIRILIGSTTKMGAGTNCQHHLVALHDLDAPWRPRDLEQRHGRILRQGNQNKEVEIFNYVVQDSFDANMWEKLKNKAAIIAQAMSNNTQLRAVEDADLVTLDYAEIEGAATGNPLIKEQLKLTNEVTKYAHGQTAFKKRQRDAQHVLDTVPAKIDMLKAAQKKIKDDISKRVSTKGDAFKAVIDGKTYTERTKADAALQKVLGKFTTARPVSIGKIGGMEIKASYSAGVYSVDGQSSGKVTLQLVGNHAYVLQSNSIQGMENTLNKGPEKLLADNNAAIEKYEADIKEAKETMESEYPHAKELKEMQHRLDEINREIENSLVDGGNSESGETKYSVVNDEENEAHNMTTEEFADEVRKTFPNAKDFQRNGNEITFTLPNGSKVTVSLVDHIAMTEEEKAKASGDYGREIDDRDYAEGSFEGVGKDAFIQLAKGNRVGTLFHEAYHFAKKVALNAKEKEFLSKRYKNEEAEAEAYRAWRVARDRTGMFGKIWRKIKDIAEDMSNILGIETEGHIFRGIESGDVYNNTDRGSSNTRDIKYMLTEEAKNNLFNVIAQKVDGDVRNWQKLGINDKEIRARLNEDNSESREEILKRMRATYNEMKVAVAQGPEARKAIVTRVLRGKALPAGMTYETQFNEYMEKAKELIDYAGKYYTAISRDKSRNGDFALELHAVADVERRRNEALEAGRRERENKGRTFSIVHHSDDNSTPSLVERIKRRFAGASKVDSNYRKMAKEMLENLTQTKISWGKLDKDTKILYKELQGVIRVAKPYDWATLMPKVGEIVAKRMGLPNNSTMHNYIADWIMTGAVGNNSSAAQMFQQAMKKNDYMSDRLLDVQNLFVEHSDKATHDFLQNVVSFEKPRPKDSWHDKLNQYYDDWIEELGPVKRMVEAIEKTREKPLPIGVNPYVWFRLLRGHYGKAITMVEGNSHMAVVALQQLYPNVSFGGFKTLSMILKEIGADGDKKRRQEFSEYCVAKHVLDIHEANNKIRDAQKKYQDQIAESEDENVIAGLKEQIEKLEADIMDTPISETRCREIISKGNKAFDKGQQDIVRYSNTLLALLYDGGVISDKRYQRTLDKWPNYVPMFRVFEENEAVEFGDSLKGQEGSTRQVIDPLESIVRNTFDFVKRAEKNKCKLMLANLARCSGVGEYIDVVEANSKPNLNDTITFYMNGKRRYLVTDPSVVKAVNGMDRDNSSVLLRILQVPVKIARACFVIINPSFAIRNLFRDAADATVYSKYGFTPKDIIGGFMHALRRDNVYYEWLTSGAAQSSALSVDRNYAQSTLDRMTMSRKEKAMSPKYLLDILQAAGEYSEYATRIGVYEKSVAGARKQGQTLNGAILTAALESRDMMDFARGGRKSRTLNKVSLFANAAIQGWDKFFRVFDPRDKKTFMRAAIRLGLTAVLPALIFSLACRGDDWWEELPDWMKENNWVFKLGDTIIRIPKGQDIGIRFCSNFVEKAVGKTSKLTLDSMFKPLKDQIPSIAPFAIMPVMESMANYSFFTEGPVVPGYLSKLPEDKQYNTNTSSLAKFIGSHTGISPMKIDHVIYGYTGNVGRAPNELINWLSKDNKSMPNATDLPILNGVTYMPYKNPASVTKFYDEWDKAQKEHNLYKQTGKIREGYSERKYEKLKAANKEMLELAKKERAVVANQSISNSEQYDKQMNIQKRRMQIAEKAIK